VLLFFSIPFSYYAPSSLPYSFPLGVWVSSF
jgi:hypothetical protein